MNDIKSQIPSLNNTWSFQGYKIRYVKLGSGEPIIFLHNIGADHRIWDYQIRHFSKTNTVFALDLLGFGESDHPSIDYNLDLYTKLLTSFIEEQGLTSVTLVGICVGSAMSLNYAAKNPHKVKQIILVSLLSEEAFKRGKFGYIYRISKLPGGGRCLELFSRYIKFPRFYVEMQLKKLYGKNGFKGEPDAEFIEHLHYLFSRPDHFNIFIKSILNLKSYKALDTMTMNESFLPLCIIWGENNKVLPVSTGRKLCSQYNCTETHFIQGGGHLVMREKNEEINAIMGKFIKNTEI